MGSAVGLLSLVLLTCACGSLPPGSPAAGSAIGVINGECEMVFANGVMQPCRDIRLVVHAVKPEHDEERTAEITGAVFRFTGLSARNYRLSAESDRYFLETDTKDTVSPGQTLKIRVRAKPR